MKTAKILTVLTCLAALLAAILCGAAGWTTATTLFGALSAAAFFGYVLVRILK